MKTLFQKILLLVFVVIFMNYFLLAQGKEENQQTATEIRLGYSTIIFQDSKPEDANAAIVVWAKVLQKNLLLEYNKKTEFIPHLYNSIEAMQDALQKKEVDILGITFPDYYVLKEKFHLVPAFTGLIDENIYSQYVLLTHNDSGLDNLTSLSQKTLAQPTVKQNPFIDIWLSNLLLSQKKTTKESFFNKVKIEDREANAIYSVFFRKSDCAIVLRKTFDVICMLNPQIKKSVKIIETSPNLVLSFAVYRQETEPSRVKLFVDVAKGTHHTPDGNNILKVFKVKKLIEISEKDLESTKQVMDLYNKNRNKRKN